MVEIKVIDTDDGKVMKHMTGDLLVACLFTDRPGAVEANGMIFGSGQDVGAIIEGLADLYARTVTSLCKDITGRQTAALYFQLKLFEALAQEMYE